MSSSSAAADSCRAWGATESVFSSPSVFQSGSEKLNASGRVKSRPRLVKVRRHLGSQQGRLGSSQAEIDPGFNPFRAASDAANVNDGGRCNLLDNLNCEFDSVKSENVDFVFGANKSAPAANFSEETEGFGNNVSSSFNMNEKRGSALNLNSKEKISNCSMRKCAFDQKVEVEEVGKRYEEIGFVFGANETHSVPNSKSGNAKSTRTVGNCKSDDKGKIKIESNGDCGAGLRESMSEVNNGQRGYCEGSTSFFVDDKENVKVCTGSNSRNAAADVVGPVNSLLDKGGGEGGSSFGANSNRSFNSNASTSSEIFRSIGSDAPNICTGSVMYDCDAKTQSCKMGLNGDIWHASGTDHGSCSSRGISNTCGTHSVSELSVEINKLRFDGAQNFDGAHTFKSSEINSSSQPNDMFVFGSNGKNPCSPTRTSVSLACGASGMFTFQAEVPKNFTIEKHLTQVNDVSGMNGSAKPSSSTVPNSRRFEAHKRSTQKQGQENDDADLHGATKPSPSSVPNDSVFEACLGSESSCTSKPEEIGVQFVSPLTPKPEARTSLEGFCPGLHEQMASAKSRSVKDRKLKKWRGKLRQGTLDEKYSGNDLISDKIGSLGSPNSSQCYSPMDFSPYQVVMTEAQCSSTTSTTPHKLSNLDCNLAPSATNSKISAVKDDIISTKESSGIDGDYYIGLNKESFQSQCEKQFIDPKSPYHKSSTNQSCFDSGVSDPFLNVGVSCPRTSRQESTSEGKKIFASSSEDFNRTSFTFSAPSPAQVCPSAVKHRNRKKYRSKSSHDSASNKMFTCVQSGPSSSSQFPSVASSPAVGEANSQRRGQSIQGNVKSVENEGQVKQQACERWKSRGNQAYRSGKFSKAEEFYTKGISSVPSDEKSEWSLDPLVMCYSNRAAARMSLGKIQEAIGDCMMAVGLDPTFLKAHIRSANCHLLLGEVDEALHHFSTCVDIRSDVCLDRRMIIEASEGKQKAQKVDQCAKKSAELLQKKTYDAAASALGKIDEALSISSYSERLLELKAEALYMLQKYEEVVRLCRKTSDFAEKNLSPYAANIKNSTCTRSLCWRSYLIAKSYFCMGKLEAALDLLEKKQPRSNIVRLCNEHLDSSTKLAASICELLRNKNLGNASFQAGRYLVAVEHYTTALTMNVESKPFAAILFCNRGAAYQALGQLTDAIADTSLAIALDETYQKAISRRATLHEKIRDYDQAANDLRTLISLLEKKSPGSPSTKEINQAQRRLSTMEDESRRGTTMDLYLILGVQASEEASEIKKAYRKAALRHHPDKAGQFLTKSGVGDDGRVWKEIIEKVHRDADRLFKMIGEAYAVLSDPTKRSVYDREEKSRRAPKETNGSSMYPPSQDGCSYPYGNMNRSSWHYEYKTYGNSYSRW